LTSSGSSEAAGSRSHLYEHTCERERDSGAHIRERERQLSTHMREREKVEHTYERERDS
jgi:hypothetical protein